MHTDEYAISLSRELAVCRSIVRKIRKALADLENRHGMTTAAFLAGPAGPGASVPKEDAASWREQHEALERWEAREREYGELYRDMKG